MCRKYLTDILFPMKNMHLDAELLTDMLGQVLGAVDAAVLSARATEAEHQTGEASLDVAGHVMVGQLIDGFEEIKNLTTVFQESNHRFVKSREFLVGLIAAGVVGGTTVEDIASAIARRILGNSFLIGEAIDAHHERTLAVKF